MSKKIITLIITVPIDEIETLQTSYSIPQNLSIKGLVRCISTPKIFELGGVFYCIFILEELIHNEDDDDSDYPTPPAAAALLTNG